MELCGGVSKELNANDKIQTIVDQVKSRVEAKTGKTYNYFKAVKYTSQVVNGMNYRIKVQVGGSEYIHVRVYDKHGSLSVTWVEEGKSASDEL